MSEYEFSLTYIFFCIKIESQILSLYWKYGSAKTSILTYFTECQEKQLWVFNINPIFLEFTLFFFHKKIYSKVETREKITNELDILVIQSVFVESSCIQLSKSITVHYRLTYKPMSFWICHNNCFFLKFGTLFFAESQSTHEDEGEDENNLHFCVK